MKKKINNKWTSFIILGLLYFQAIPGIALADDIRVTINGSVTAIPCDVKTTSADVVLEDLYTFNLKNTNSSSNWHPVTLDLVNCPTQTTIVTATISGVSDPTYPNYYKNQGTAKYIQLELRDDKGVNLKNASTRKLTVNSSTKSVTFPLEVRAISVAGNATEGTIQATINVTYTYE